MCDHEQSGVRFKKSHFSGEKQQKREAKSDDDEMRVCRSQLKDRPDICDSVHSVSFEFGFLTTFTLDIHIVSSL